MKTFGGCQRTRRRGGERSRTGVSAEDEEGSCVAEVGDTLTPPSKETKIIPVVRLEGLIPPGSARGGRGRMYRPWQSFNGQDTEGKGSAVSRMGYRAREGRERAIPGGETCEGGVERGTGVGVRVERGCVRRVDRWRGGGRGVRPSLGTWPPRYHAKSHGAARTGTATRSAPAAERDRRTGMRGTGGPAAGTNPRPSEIRRPFGDETE